MTTNIPAKNELKSVCTPWVNMFVDVRHYCKSCKVCCVRKPKQSCQLLWHLIVQQNVILIAQKDLEFEVGELVSSMDQSQEKAHHKN